MLRAALLPLVLSSLVACGDDATTSSAGPGGGDGEGGEAATTVTSSTSSTTEGAGAAGGDGPTSTTSTGEGAGGSGGEAPTSTGSTGGEGGSGGAGGAGGGGGALPTCDEGTPDECAAIWEDAAAARFDEVVSGDPAGWLPFFTEIPKGADLHQHLSGSVYAETYLDWGREDDFCINTTTFVAVFEDQCSAATAPIPTSGPFYDDIVRAWSMKDFVPGVETGHDHFFATFGKFGAIAGVHRYQSIADVALRAAAENLLHVETMFNMGRNVGELSSDLWSGTLTEADLPALYDAIVNDPSFEAEVDADVAVAEQSMTGYRAELGCGGASPPAACDVGVRFTAQVSRTGARDMVFGQLVGAFEMAMRTPHVVAANLSSPEDDPTSINAYMLHMGMLDFLHEQYAGRSPLHITLHAGELTDEVLPPGSDADTFHIREAIDRGHAERIGHGLDIESEIGSQQILDDMRTRDVLVEICLSSNVQILGVAGEEHPVGLYVDNGVPVAIATDDQGVSRSSLAGEYVRAAIDQDLSYRDLKRMARDSADHAFLPGESLWASITELEPVAACETTDTMGLGEEPNAACAAFLAGSERARLSWALERRFRIFESQQ